MTYNYDDRISFENLPSDFVYSKEINDEGKECISIKAGMSIDDDGDTIYSFSCSVNVTKHSPNDFENESDNLLNHYLHRMSDPKYYTMTGEHKAFLMNKISETPVLFLTLRYFSFLAAIQLTDWSFLELMSINHLNDEEEDVRIIKDLYDKMYTVLRSVRIDGKSLPMDSFSLNDMKQLLLPKDQEEDEEDDISALDEREHKILDGSPSCGIWLVLNQITSLCRNTEFFSEDDIDIIEEGLTTHEFIVSSVLKRNPVLYERALQSQEVAVSYMLSIPINNGKEAISIFEHAKKSALPSNFEKAFILISLFFDIPYEPAASLPYTRKREIMQDCRGFVNSMNTIISMQGFEYKLPDYCQADDISVRFVGAKPDQESKANPIDFKFTQNKEYIVDNELVIPVPDGYQSYSEDEEGIGERILVITPEGYPKDENPYDAEFAMMIPQQFDAGMPFDPDNTEAYKTLFSTTYQVFKENVRTEDVGCRDNFGILYQNYYDDNDPSYNKIIAMIFTNSGGYITHIFYNHPGLDSRDRNLIHRFVSSVDKWMQMFRLTTESPSRLLASDYNGTHDPTPSKETSIKVVQLTENSDGVDYFYGELQGYTGNYEHIALPEETDTVGYDAFSCNTSVQTVVVPEGVTKIDNDAFYFAHISCVVLPSTLDSVGTNAFRSCSELKEIILPDGLTEIGDDAFTGCDNLKYIYIPSSVYDFGDDCFFGLDNCIFHVEPGSDAEDYLRDNYDDYTIVYHKPAGYGDPPEIKIVNK